jgi:hypothetical protein
MPNDLVSVERVRKEALGQTFDAEQTTRLLDRLEQARWLKKKTTRTKGRSRHRWEINKKLFADAESVGSAESGFAGNGGSPASAAASATSELSAVSTLRASSDDHEGGHHG